MQDGYKPLLLFFLHTKKKNHKTAFNIHLSAAKKSNNPIFQNQFLAKIFKREKKSRFFNRA